MRISLIHALALSITPISDAFSAHWPQAATTHLLDDSLSTDLAREGSLTPRMFARFGTLAQYSVDNGAAAILFTCSAFAPCIDAVKAKHQIPILRPNEAMFDLALDAGRKIGLISSFPPSITTMTPELHAMARARGAEIELTTASDPRAMQALQAGDGTTHDALLAALATSMSHCDVVMLAQFSTARAAAAVQANVNCPVLTSPGSAVQRLKAILQ